MKQRITPCLWFDQRAEEAARFYVSVFKNGKITSILKYGKAASEASGQPEGSTLTVSFEVHGQEFLCLNGGPEFKFSPAVSFYVSCDSHEEMDELWEKLSEGGKTLMALDTYPFRERFGWLEDQFGLSWQLSFDKQAQKICPLLMFVRENHGKAEEAMNYYISIFDDSKLGEIKNYGESEEEPENNTDLASFMLAGQTFMAMDSSVGHNFTFSLAVSFTVNCETQEEVDRYWDSLGAGGQIIECGWLQDKYGLAWQVVPVQLEDYLHIRPCSASSSV